MTARCKFVCVSKREFVLGGVLIFEHQFQQATIASDGTDDQSVSMRWYQARRDEVLTVMTTNESPFQVTEQYYFDIAPTQEIIDVAMAKQGVR